MVKIFQLFLHQAEQAVHVNWGISAGKHEFRKTVSAYIVIDR